MAGGVNRRRTRNVRITVEVTPAVAGDLERLLRSGLFGISLEAVAEGLLLAELRRLAVVGWVPRAHARPSR